MIVVGIDPGTRHLGWGVVVREGTRILSSAFAFDVENPCSGIRSLMALTTVTAAWPVPGRSMAIAVGLATGVGRAGGLTGAAPARVWAMF